MKEEKINWIEAIQYSKGWYNKYFPEKLELDRVEKWRIIQGILCGCETKYVKTTDLMIIVSPLFLKYVLQDGTRNSEMIFRELVSFESIQYWKDNMDREYVRKVLLQKMFSELGFINVQRKSGVSVGGKEIWEKCFPIGKPNKDLIKKLKLYFKENK